MPRYLNQDKRRVPNVTIQKAWIQIPVKSSKDTTPFNDEAYLIPTRVADYIVLLESKIKGDLPKLPRKNE